MPEQPKMGGGLRHNKGKLRLDLVPVRPMEAVAGVLTQGAEKYAERNWELGMQWSKTLASLKRHIAAWEKGEDFDPESGQPHMAHVATNAFFLLEYMHTYPQGDDRPHNYLKRPKIGLDIDEVLCDWVGGWSKKFGSHPAPAHWNFDYSVYQRYKEFDPEEMKQFYLTLKPRVDPSELTFEPHAYITSRSVDKAVTEQWLQMHHFPTAPVYTVGHGVSKVDACRQAGIDIMVDDRYENFVELNRAGICCFLWDASHNQKYNVGYKRIFRFSDLTK